jgi:hypothetical protein
MGSEHIGHALGPQLLFGAFSLLKSDGRFIIITHRTKFDPVETLVAFYLLSLKYPNPLAAR